MSARPFRILGIQQIAIGGPSKERLKTLWVDKLGLTVTGNFVSGRTWTRTSAPWAAARSRSKST